VNGTFEATCSRLQERLHRDKDKLTFLTLFFKPVFRSLKLILPINENNRDHIFKAIQRVKFQPFNL